MLLTELTPEKIKKMSIKELKKLAEEIRSFLINEIPKTGGHLGSNLGIVELTIALHYVFDSPTDQLIFDVGHQAYTHKILTGRASEFSSLRKINGLSGYTSYGESIHDCWESGHAGTSISAMVGVLYAKNIKQAPGLGIAIIGDASISNGTAFEALNHLGSDKNHKGIIVLNDNKMGISKSIGAVSRLLSNISGSGFVQKTKHGMKRYFPKFIVNFLRRINRSIKGFFHRKNIFEDMGYQYIGPVDGHSLKQLIKSLTQAKKTQKSVVVHALTIKGKGHHEAEIDEVGHFHGININGSPMTFTFSEVVSNALIDLYEFRKIFVVMPAMAVGSKFTKFSQLYPKQFVDVGIAEEHAAVMSAAMAKEEIPVFLPIYSTFSQRAFDQILNDIVRPNLKVIIGIDRAGVVGEDGSTHQGLFDQSMFNLMPNIKIAAPMDQQETRDIMYHAFLNQDQTMIIRYPRENVVGLGSGFNVITENWVQLTSGNQINIISYGPSLEMIKRAVSKCEASANIINARFIKPLDYQMLDEISANYLPILIYEEATSIGGLSSEIIKYYAKKGYKSTIKVMSITDQVVAHGTREEILVELNMDETAVIDEINKIVGNDNND